MYMFSCLIKEFRVFCLKMVGRIDDYNSRGSLISSALPLRAHPIMFWDRGDSRVV